ncbi:hypothetical protein pEaSNUABM5_00063 [Erwinia phage pEa_SNUABM_5]|uniref:Uncharacterized protein n=1 Tax=Erwinia phage pEa_SNUABM_5 TaxID=2797313 RepID=A0A7T8EPC8_9CAUD|nr:hypothetical protein MPK73_gp063 [Erwinia phage pEa_SNUABM_5]QQO90205.1 hypothetical protein pEaSNUABM5_00063 [Erwinia phage pEa_SNUABM_5]
MNGNRYYASLDIAEQEESELLRERIHEHNLTKAMSFLYVNKQTDRALAKDHADGRMITVAGNGKDSGNYHLIKGVTVQSTRRS